MLKDKDYLKNLTGKKELLENKVHIIKEQDNIKQLHKQQIKLIELVNHLI